MESYDFLGKGFHFPFEPEPATGRIRMAKGEDDIREAVAIILRTRKGERVMRPDFGCDICQYMFGTMDYTSLTMIEKEVRKALVCLEPRITHIEVEAKQDDEEDNAVLVKVRYLVRDTNNPYNLVFPFYLEEGIGSDQG